MGREDNEGGREEEGMEDRCQMLGDLRWGAGKEAVEAVRREMDANG